MNEAGRTVFVLREVPAHWLSSVVDAAHTLGLRAAVVTPAVAEHEHADLVGLADDVCVVADIRDAEEVAERIRAATGGARPAGVLTAAEDIIATAARTAELLGVGRCPADVLRLAHNKFAVRQLLAEAGLPGPRHALVSETSEATAVAESVGLPAVVKPVNGAASTLVRTVRSTDELAQACALLARRLPEAPDARYHRPVADRAGGSLDPRRVFLVEGLLRGPEYMVDVVVSDGVAEPVAIVDKPLIDERAFELAMACPPLTLSGERATAITDVVVRSVLALGLDNTVAHVEVIDDEVAGPTIVEINAGRPVGGATAELIKLHTGVDMFAEFVAVAAGLPRPEPAGNRIPVPLGELIVYPPGGGRLVAIHGLDAVRELPEVISIVTTVSPGQVLSGEQEVYAVNVFVAGFTDHDELAALYDEVTKLVRIELEPLD